MSYHMLASRDARGDDGQAPTLVVALYGGEDSPSFAPGDGPFLCWVRVPDDAELRRCEKYGGVELFCGVIDHAGPEAVLQFADEESDPDFWRMPKSPEVPPMTTVFVIRPPK